MKERGSDKERKRGSTEYRYMEGAPCGYCGVRPLVSLSRVHLYFFLLLGVLFFFSSFPFLHISISHVLYSLSPFPSYQAPYLLLGQNISLPLPW